MSISFGISLNLRDPAIVEIAGWLGYRFAWIDCEHTIFPDVGEIIRAAEAAGIEPWVRVPENNASVISQYLSLGAARIIVPHIRSVEDAAAAVRNSKFYPTGRRNWFSKARDGRYGIIPADVYPAQRNSAVRLVVQVEDPEGIDAIGPILDVEGIDMVMTGPGDLAHGLGIAGQIDHPKIHAAEERVFAAADSRGVPVLHFANSVAELNQLRTSHPVSHVVAASDVSLMVTGLRERIQNLTTGALPRGEGT